MPAQTPETLAKLAIWRQKAVEGTLTLEEQKEAIALMRADRRSASAVSDSSRRAKAKALVPSADEMLNELGEL